jgi:hypothetical protein
LRLLDGGASVQVDQAAEIHESARTACVTTPAIAIVLPVALTPSGVENRSPARTPSANEAIAPGWSAVGRQAASQR